MQLENDHNVYILGAGFSAEAGLPLIKDFLIRMRDSHEWLQNNSRKREAEAVARVLEFRLSAASTAYWVQLDLENIEELFSLASAMQGNMDENIKLAIAATLNFASQQAGQKRCMLSLRGKSKLFQAPIKGASAALHPKWIQPVEYGDIATGDIGKFELSLYAYHVARLLGLFGSEAIKGRNTFITLNYDTVLEEALDELQIPFWYGLKGERLNFEPDANGHHVNAQVRVLKLHGSINWARSRQDSSGLNVFRNYQELLATGHTPELLAPTWKKVIEDELETVWETAVQSLNSATRIIIIGFSMPATDTHFKYLMAAGLQKNLSIRQILFANPCDRSEMETKARKVLRAAYIDSGLIDFARTYLWEFTHEQLGKCHQIGRPKEDHVTHSLQGR